MPITHGLLKGALWDPADTSTPPVQINDLVTDNEDDTFFEGPIALDDGQHDSTGGLYTGGERNTLRLTFKDDGTVYDQLKTWYDAGTRLSAVCLGRNKNVQWYETDRLSVLKPVTLQGRVQGHADVYVLEMVREDESPDIHSDVNLLAKHGWEDSDSDNVADGYTFDGGQTSTSFSGGVQSASDDATYTDLVTTIDFPIEGATLTMSTNYTALHGSATNAVLVRTEDSSGTVLTTTDNNVGSTGRHTAEITTPANTHTIRVMPMRLKSVSASGTASVKNPALRVDGSDEYIST